MFVSSALTGLAHVSVMNLEDTMAVETSVGADGVFWKTTVPTGGEERSGNADDEVLRGSTTVGSFATVWPASKTEARDCVCTADFERAVKSPSGMQNFSGKKIIASKTPRSKMGKKKRKKIRLKTEID
jgi:hypothetical protein